MKTGDAETSAALTRRQFLQHMGKSMAAGSLLPALASCNLNLREAKIPFSGQVKGEDPFLCHRLRDGELAIHAAGRENRIRDVVIIGGGVSGLAAARRLIRAGIDNILVLEKETRLGGQARGGQIDGIRYATAAHFVESPHPRAAFLVDLYRQLGIITGIADDGWPIIGEQHQVKQPYFGILAGGQWMPYSFPFQVAEKKDVKAFRAFYKDMYAWSSHRDEQGIPAFCIPAKMASPDPDIRRLDEITMAEYLRQKGFKSNVLSWYVDNRLLNEYGTDASQTSAWAGIQYWAASKSGFEDMDPLGARRQSILTWPEGNQFLVDGLSADLTPDQVMLDCLTTRIRQTENALDITFIDTKTKRFKTVTSRYVIYASPKNMIYKIIPDLSTANRHEFNLCQYVPWITSTVYVRRSPSSNQGQIAWDNMPYGRGWALGYIAESHVSGVRKPSGRTVLTYYGALHSNMKLERRELLEGDWHYWASILLDELEYMHPGITSDIEQMDIYKWAHAMVVPRPGLIWSKERERMEKPYGNVHFAHSDISGLSIFEEAVYHGIRAAQQVLASMGIACDNMLAEGQWEDR